MAEQEVELNEGTKPANDGQGGYTPVPQGPGGDAKEDHTTVAPVSSSRPWLKPLLTAIVVFIVLIIIIAIVLPLVLMGSQGKTVETTTIPPVSKTLTTPVGSTSITPTYTMVTTTPYPGVILTGTVVTTNNYTASLANPSSPQYTNFTNLFESAVHDFYQVGDGQFADQYDKTVVEGFGRDQHGVQVNFLVYLSSLNDLVIPNAHTALLTQIQDQGRLGMFHILSGDLKQRT